MPEGNKARMSTQVPTTEPSAIVAGDTIKWLKSLSCYPAPTWTLTYAFRGPANIDVLATAEGADHLVNIPAATSAVYTAGLYSLSARVTNGTDVYSVPLGASAILIKANPATITAGTDLRSTAAKSLAAVKDAILKLSSKTAATVTLNGQSYTLQDLEKLMKLQGFLQSQVNAEIDAENIAAGLGSRKNILVRFGNPR